MLEIHSPELLNNIAWQREASPAELQPESTYCR